MIGDFMLKKICYKTKNLLALIPNYELKSIKTHYYNEDGDYDKEEFYLVNNNYKIIKDWFMSNIKHHLLNLVKQMLTAILKEKQFVIGSSPIFYVVELASSGRATV